MIRAYVHLRCPFSRRSLGHHAAQPGTVSTTETRPPHETRNDICGPFSARCLCTLFLGAKATRHVSITNIPYNLHHLASGSNSSEIRPYGHDRVNTLNSINDIRIAIMGASSPYFDSGAVVVPKACLLLYRHTSAYQTSNHLMLLFSAIHTPMACCCCPFAAFFGIIVMRHSYLPTNPNLIPLRPSIVSRNHAVEGRPPNNNDGCSSTITNLEQPV